MEQQLRQQIRKIIDICFRRKKLIGSCLLITASIGLGYYLNTPKVYESAATIIYERARINPTKMSPDVQTKTREMVNTLSQQVLSRSNLEEIIVQFDLYADARARMPIEDVIASMRSTDITIRQDKGGDTFKVTYRSKDPKKTMLVTNALAAKFIEENMRYREERATETSAYVKDELKMAKLALDEKESIMRDYKLQHYNEMADRLQINMARLTALQTQAQTAQTSIQDLERTKVMIQEQITMRKDALNQQAQQAQNAPQAIAAASAAPTTSPEVQELKRVQAELAGLRARYTDSHPEVKRLQGLVAYQEQKVASMPATAPPPAPVQQAPAASPRPVFDEKTIMADRQFAELTRQLSEIEFNITQLRRDQGSYRQEIDKYNKWVEMAPVREAEWSSLTRDYEQLSRHYQDLVARDLAAESAETLEKRQKGSQFKIIDPAHFPIKPAAPNFLIIMLLGLAGGLCVGGGLSLALEFTDTSFKDAGELETYLHAPLLCSIPIVSTANEKRKNRAIAIAWGLGFFIYIDILIVLIIVLWRKGTIIM